jgi:hypothetical protein
MYAWTDLRKAVIRMLTDGLRVLSFVDDRRRLHKGFFKGMMVQRSSLRTRTTGLLVHVWLLFASFSAILYHEQRKTGTRDMKTTKAT